MTLRWRVAYWESERVVMRASADWAWHALPQHGVLWVDLVWGSEPWRQRLMGRDNYWLHEGRFGMFNDPGNWGWYGGGPAVQYVAWRATADGGESINPVVPDRAHVLTGALVPDETAWALGLLDPGQRLPARPT